MKSKLRGTYISQISPIESASKLLASWKSTLGDIDDVNIRSVLGDVVRNRRILSRLFETNGTLREFLYRCVEPQNCYRLVQERFRLYSTGMPRTIYDNWLGVVSILTLPADHYSILWDKSGLKDIHNELRCNLDRYNGTFHDLIQSEMDAYHTSLYKLIDSFMDHYIQVSETL
jgi:hypothetical protein